MRRKCSIKNHVDDLMPDGNKKWKDDTRTTPTTTTWKTSYRRRSSQDKMENFSNYNMDKNISIRSMTPIEDKDFYDCSTIVD